jgi:hypothetical protein
VEIIMANIDVINYIRYVNGSGISNSHISLSEQIINIQVQNNYYVKYTSDVDIDYNYGSDCYIVTINNDSCAAYMHKAIYWSTKYDFTFNENKLEFIHEGRKIYISKN